MTTAEGEDTKEDDNSGITSGALFNGNGKDDVDDIDNVADPANTVNANNVTNN